MQRTIIRLALCCAAAVALAGCGGSSDPEPKRPERKAVHSGEGTAGTQTDALGRRELPAIRRMLDRLVNGINARDASVCTDVYTTEYREKLMERKGAAAIAACRRIASNVKFQVALVRIETVDIRRAPSGRVSGNVEVVQRIGAQGMLRTQLAVVRSGGHYRIDGNRSVRIPDPKQVPGGGTG